MGSDTSKIATELDALRRFVAAAKYPIDMESNKKPASGPVAAGHSREFRKTLLPRHSTMKPTLTVLFVCLSAGIAACARDPSTQLDCGSISRLDDSSYSYIELQREYAREIAKRARSVRLRIEGTGSAAGFVGMFMRRIPGTDAYDIGVEIGTLRELVARQVAREQAHHNDGHALVPMEQSWACEMLADSVLSLDPVQSKQQLMEHLAFVERHFEAATHKQ